jgi:hypothetical protein
MTNAARERAYQAARLTSAVTLIRIMRAEPLALLRRLCKLERVEAADAVESDALRSLEQFGLARYQSPSVWVSTSLTSQALRASGR